MEIFTKLKELSVQLGTKIGTFGGRRPESQESFLKFLNSIPMRLETLKLNIGLIQGIDQKMISKAVKKFIQQRSADEQNQLKSITMDYSGSMVPTTLAILQRDDNGDKLTKLEELAFLGASNNVSGVSDLGMSLLIVPNLRILKIEIVGDEGFSDPLVDGFFTAVVTT